MRGPPRKSVVLFLAASWLRRARASFVAPRTMTRRRPSLLAMLLLKSALIPSPLPLPSAPSALPHLIPFAEAADTAGRRRRREKETPRKRKRWYDEDEQEEGGDGDGGGGLHLSLDALFVTRKPRDVLEGARAALSNACRGAFYGLVALVAAPAAGLKAGPAGAAAGLAAGVVAAPLLSLVGVAIGGFQLLRGITETPTAIVDGFLGCQRWNETARAWQEYRLDEDAVHIDAALNQEEELRKIEERTTRRQGRRRVKSKEYYDLLGVAPDAAPSALRSAYRSKARQVHPDKNPGDPAAAARFRELSTAYQTLSDPARRKQYDASGVGADAHQGMADVSAFDPTVFFAVLFGAEAVEPYVGELWMATAFDALFKLGNGTVSLDSWEDVKTALGWSEEALKRRKREANIAAHLRARVADYADELLAHDAFRDSCREEAKEIAAGGSYGAEFLLAIGPALVAEADAFLGYRSSVRESWRGPVSNTKRRLLYLRRQSDATISVLRTMLKSIKALYNSAEARPDTTRDERLKDEFSRTLPSMLRTAWAINRVDITHALRGACEKLFHDADVSSREERLRRVEAVRVLGSQFYSVGMESAAAMGGTATSQGRGDVDEIKAQANAAFMESLRQGTDDEKNKRSTSDEM